MTANDDPPWDLVEAGWERSIPMPELTPAFFAEHLGEWPELLARKWTPLSGGLRSLNLRSGDLVARIALPGRESVTKERALLELVGEAVRVPKIVAASPLALIQEFVPHERLPETREAGRRTGEAARRLHGARAFPGAGLLDDALEIATPFASALEGLRTRAATLFGGRAGERLGAERRAALEALWARHADALEAACADSVLVHSDFKPTNVKWLPERADVLVLDWEFAWAGPALYDIGQLLRWPPSEDFLLGLEESLGDELPPNWRRLAEALDAFNLVGFLRLEGEGRRERDVLGRLDRTLSAP